MRTAPPAIALCVMLAVAGCGGDDAPAGDSPRPRPATGSTAAPTDSPVGAEPEKRARPIEIRVGGRVFKRAEPEVKPPPRQPPTGLIVKRLIDGAGAKAVEGDELTVEYVGIYYDGSSFTNSWERSKPFSFELGGSDPLVNPGWERGLKGMRAGERRELVVGPRFLYRGGPQPGSTPADTIVYVVDLIRID